MNNTVLRMFWGIMMIVLLEGFPLSSQAGDLENTKFYEIEQGRIDYTVSGVNNGTESMKWNNWGQKTVRRTTATMSMMGITRSIDQLMYTDGLWIYNVDETANTTTKMENPMLKDMAKQKDLDMKKVGTDFMKAMGGKIIGTKTILGKTCDMWEMKQMMTKTCVWRGIPLITIAGMPGMEVTQTAVDIKIGSIPDSQVTLPSHVKVVEHIDPFKQMQEMQGLGNHQDMGRMKNDTGKTRSEAPDMRKMMEQLKKLQEQMQQR